MSATIVVDASLVKSLKDRILEASRARDKYISEMNGEILGRIGFFNGQIEAFIGLLPEDARQEVAKAAGLELKQGPPADDPLGDSPV